MKLLYIFWFISCVLWVSYAKVACDICMDAIQEVDDVIAANGTIEDMEELATIICEFDDAGGECEGPHNSWQCEQVCQLAIQTYEPMVDYLLIRYMDPQLICYNIENNTFGCDKPDSPDPTPVPNIVYDNDTRTVYNSSDRFGYILHIPGYIIFQCIDYRCFVHIYALYIQYMLFRFTLGSTIQSRFCCELW